MADIVKFSVSKEIALNIFRNDIPKSVTLAKEEGDYFEFQSPMFSSMRAYVKVNDSDYEIGIKKGPKLVVKTLINMINSAFKTCVDIATGRTVGLGSPSSSQVKQEKQEYTIEDFNKALDSIERMKKMRDEGILSEEEFQEYKAKLLENNLSSKKSETKSSQTPDEEVIKTPEVNEPIKEQPSQAEAIEESTPPVEEVINEEPKIEEVTTPTMEEPQTKETVQEEISETPVEVKLEEPKVKKEKPLKEKKQKPVKEKKVKQHEELYKAKKYKVAFISSLSSCGALILVGIAIMIFQFTIGISIATVSLIIAIILGLIYGLRWKKYKSLEEADNKDEH